MYVLQSTYLLLQIGKKGIFLLFGDFFCFPFVCFIGVEVFCVCFGLVFPAVNLRKGTV